jgi:hypothetical protein
MESSRGESVPLRRPGLGSNLRTMDLVGLVYRVYILVALVIITGCGGSSVAPEGEGESVRGAQSSEKRMFSVMSRYYCEHKRWPKTLDEVTDFAESVEEEGLAINDFLNPRLTSSRAVVLTLGYDTELGARRKVSFIAPPRCDDEKVDGEISIAAGRIRFEVPTGFALMNAEAVKARWRASPFPDAVWRDEDGLLIAIRFGDVEVTSMELEALVPSLTEAYESSVPSLKWLRKGHRVIDSRAVLEHEFESDSSTGRLVNFVISTSFDDKLLAISLMSRVEDAERVEKVAAQVESSLRIN